MSARDYFAKLLGLRQAFRRTFNGPNGKPHADGRMVLEHLRGFCYAERSTIKFSPIAGRVDPLAMAAAEGRREVYNRIVSYLNLDDTDLVLMEKHSEAADG